MKVGQYACTCLGNSETCIAAPPAKSSSLIDGQAVCSSCASLRPCCCKGSHAHAQFSWLMLRVSCLRMQYCPCLAHLLAAVELTQPAAVPGCSAGLAACYAGAAAPSAILDGELPHLVGLPPTPQLPLLLLAAPHRIVAAALPTPPFASPQLNASPPAHSARHNSMQQACRHKAASSRSRRNA